MKRRDAAPTTPGTVAKTPHNQYGPPVKPSTLRRLLATLLCLFLAGCPKPDSDPKKTVELPLKGTKLRLAVVDDPALAAAVVRIQGEWNARTGSDLEVIETTEKDLLKADQLSTDAVLCPSHLLADLAERKWLVPVPRQALHNADWADVFPLIRLREAAWGKQTMAVPFGSPVFCCYYRADLLEKLNRRPPQTWAEYQELAKLLSADKKSPTSSSGTLEPLAPGWAGLVLLARAVPYAKHRDNYSTLFDIETMEPLVAGDPFVKALEELVAAAGLSPTDPLKCDPAAVRDAFWNGQCALALTWPTAAKQGRGERGEGRGKNGQAASATNSPASNSIRVGFAELPGSRKVFNPKTGAFDQRAEDENPHISLLSIAGRLGVVGKNSAHADAAFQLLLWLSNSEMSPQVSAASPATTLFRQSNLSSPSQWVEKSLAATAAVKYADATETALHREQWLGALRMPGRADYLAALDDAVANAVRGNKSPKEALLEAAARWQQITKRLGLDRQREAYRRSLGLE
jgi:multiple sugar transport system substrate-binding protein